MTLDNLLGAGKTRQGTTSVVPQMPKNRGGLSAPEACYSGISLKFRAFSASSWDCFPRGVSFRRVARGHDLRGQIVQLRAQIVQLGVPPVPRIWEPGMTDDLVLGLDVRRRVPHPRRVFVIAPRVGLA